MMAEFATEKVEKRDQTAEVQINIVSACFTFDFKFSHIFSYCVLQSSIKEGFLLKQTGSFQVGPVFVLGN